MEQEESDLHYLVTLLGEDDKNPTEIRAVFERLFQNLPKLPDPFAKKTIAATSITVARAATILGIKYQARMMEFILDLKAGSDVEIQPSSWCSKELLLFPLSRQLPLHVAARIT